MSDYTTYGHSVVHSETGVHLHLRNGITVSIQWRDWHDFGGVYAGPRTAEIAAFFPKSATQDREWVRVPGFSEDDDVNGWQFAEEVAAFISAADAMEEK
jgi:hypothetical protein